MTDDIKEIFKRLWDEIQANGPGEPNLMDFRLMGLILQLHFVKGMLQNIPDYSTGLKIVEFIEDNAFKKTDNYEIQHVVRNLHLEDFSDRMYNIARDLQLKNYLTGDITKALSAAFYIWYGCLSMAKLTRPEGSDHISYTSDMRNQGYDYLKWEWEEQSRIDNPWLKFGVQIAKLLEEKRRLSNPEKIIIDNWIPKDSPYWKGWKAER